MTFTRNRFLPASLWLIFFVNGAVLSSWAPRIPEVKHALALGDGQLGAALLGIAAGSVPALLLTGRLLQHLRPGPVSVVSALAFAASLPLISRSGSLFELIGALVLAGAVSGVLDVAMNTAGMVHQQQAGTRLLSTLHGGYSLGVLAGAASGVVATGTQTSVARHFTLMAGLLIGLTALAAVPLWRQPTQRSTAPMLTDEDRATGRRWWQTTLPTTIAALAVSALLIEGLVTDWSALLITRDLGAPASWGATALTVFSVAMFVSRSVGDAMIARVGEERVLASSAVTITLAMVSGASLGQPLLMITAAGVIGLALGPVFPLAVTRAGRLHPGQEAAMTARVSAVGYLAYLAGPPGIGALAEHLPLPTVLVLVVGLASVGIAASRRPMDARDAAGTAEAPPPEL
ncbi:MULTISPECIES: MFS transporter [unclassified Luteococcus]|uniref:MFS transporter n=1 Tax=unclassified Luteococcus TaxID=2639923 RepID=UPI00313EF077